MPSIPEAHLGTTGRSTFDVICAGEIGWKLAGPTLRPGGGAVEVARTLAGVGLRVGLATVLPDDVFGRRTHAQLAAAGVDVGGVSFTLRRPSLVLVDPTGGAHAPASESEATPPIEVPASWQASVLLLTGLSPVVSHAAAMCKAARAARRAGTFVLLDFDAGLHAWVGRDPRTIRMVLREVDAARCSIADLAVVGLDATVVRATLREDAVLVVSDSLGGAMVRGPFGEIPVVRGAPRPRGDGDALTAALCAELVRPGVAGESAAARWRRMVRGSAGPN